MFGLNADRVGSQTASGRGREMRDYLPRDVD